MNNICAYDAIEIFEKISNCNLDLATNEIFRIGKTSLHLYSSHYCNNFLTLIKDLPTEKTNKNYFIVPIAIKIRNLGCESDADNVCDRLVDSLSHFKGMEGKHVFFLVGDSTYVPKSLLQSRVFMASCPIDKADALHYTSPIIGFASRPIEDCFFDVSFQGNIKTNAIRSKLKEALKNSQLRSKFVESVALPLLPQRHPELLINSYFDLMDNSKFILCPRGMGLSSIRFFESISLGRIPVVIGNEAKIPLSDHIDWDSLIVRVKDSLEDLDEKIMSADIRSGEKLRYVWGKYFKNFDAFLDFSLNSSLKKYKKRGVLMCATGDINYFNMAQKSICILNRHEKIDSTIFTDSKKKENFSKIIHSNTSGFKSKILAILNSPYEECIYMDVDTRSCGCISQMFDLLEEKEIWMMPAPIRKPEYNTGVIVFRKTKNVLKLFSMWKKLYEEGINTPHDQPALLEAIKRLNFDVGLLDEKYNSHEEKKGTVIVHSKKALISASKIIMQ